MAYSLALKMQVMQMPMMTWFLYSGPNTSINEIAANKGPESKCFACEERLVSRVATVISIEDGAGIEATLFNKKNNGRFYWVQTNFQQSTQIDFGERVTSYDLKMSVSRIIH